MPNHRIATALIVVLLLATTLLPTLPLAAQDAPQNAGLPPAIYSLAFDNAARSTIYAATASGVYKSGDGGASWQPTSLRRRIRHLLVANRLLYAAGESGIYLSRDAGASWQPNLQLAVGVSANQLVSDPLTGVVRVIAATAVGLYASSNGGDWEAISLSGKNITALAVSNKDGAIYAADSFTLWRRDGTDDWQSLPQPGGPINQLLVDDGGAVYAATMRGLFRSVDSGQNWQPLLKDAACTFVGLRLRPSGTVIYAESGGLLQSSSDNGATWQPINGVPTGGYHQLVNGPDERTTYLAADSGLWTIVAENRFSLLPLQAARADHLAYGISRDAEGSAQTYLFATRAGFVYRSTNAGATWASASGGLRGLVDDLLLTGRGRLLAATQVGLYTSDDGGSSWQVNPDVACGPVASLSQHPTETATQFATCALGGLYRSADDGRTWQPLAAEQPLALSRLAVDPTSPQVIYAASDGDVPLWRSVDGGQNWRSISANMTPLPMRGGLGEGESITALLVRPLAAPAGLKLTIAEAQPVTVYALTETALYVSGDAGRNWQVVSLPPAARNQPLHDILLAADNLYLATATGLYASADGGVGWQRVGDQQPLYTLAANVTPGSLSIYGAGAEGAAFASYTTSRTQASVAQQTYPTDRVPPITGLRYFPETGHNLGGNFLRFWQQYDGIRVFGYPLTEAITETVATETTSQTLTVQWFERVRLEYHSELTATEPVVISLLGRELTAGRYFINARFRAGPEIEFFPQTSHVVQSGFLKYWRAYGGLFIFGYPISNETRENGLTVQWFERTRFEYRPEYAGTEFEVQQTQLGRLVLRQRGWLR